MTSHDTIWHPTVSTHTHSLHLPLVPSPFLLFPCRYLAVDGGVNLETGALAAAAGANVLIAGTSIFGKDRQEKSQSNSNGKDRQEKSDSNGSGHGNKGASNDSGSDRDKLFIANNIRALEQILMSNGRWPPMY